MDRGPWACHPWWARCWARLGPARRVVAGSWIAARDNGVVTATSSPVLIILTDRDRAELESLARARKAPLRSVQRAWIVLAAANGQYNAQIARDLGLHLDNVRTWRGRFAADGMKGLTEAAPLGTPAGVRSHRGRRGEGAGLSAARRARAATVAVVCQDLADEAVARGITESVSGSTVRRWLAADAIKPWRHRSWIFPRDPDFAVKAARVLDLYDRPFEGRRLRPDEYVISADELCEASHNSSDVKSSVM